MLGVFPAIELFFYRFIILFCVSDYEVGPFLLSELSRFGTF